MSEFDLLTRDYQNWARTRQGIWDAEEDDWAVTEVKVEHMDGTVTVEEYSFSPDDMSGSDDDGVELLRRFARFLGIEVDEDEG